MTKSKDPLNFYIQKLRQYSDDQLIISIKKYPAGYWLNPITREWVQVRIYTKIKNGSNYPQSFLTKLCHRLNKRSLYYGIQIMDRKLNTSPSPLK